MIEDTFFESLAHYASGMATMSFCVWAVTLYRWRTRNRMTRLLFLCVAYIAVSFLKDIVFLLPPQCLADGAYVENLVSFFDMGFVPLVCSFFLETTRPGVVTRPRLAAFCLPFLALALLYVVRPAGWVLTALFALAAVATMVAVAANVARYSRWLSDNYSYTKDISVGWCTGCTAGFFLLLAFYELCFYRPTWFSEMAYDAGFVAVWNIVCLKSRRHRVVAGIMAAGTAAESAPAAQEAPPGAPVTDAGAQDGGRLPDAPVEGDGSGGAAGQPGGAVPRQPQPGEAPLPQADGADGEQDRYAFIAGALERCMERERLYLNARLSLPELAAAVGTNKTYISTYLNSQGCTFYDFINRYRVAEACRIIDRMATGGRLSMADVAARSGFNSISSFNRYFFKVKGVTPTAYSRRG